MSKRKNWDCSVDARRVRPLDPPMHILSEIYPWVWSVWLSCHTWEVWLNVTILFYCQIFEYSFEGSVPTIEDDFDPKSEPNWYVRVHVYSYQWRIQDFPKVGHWPHRGGRQGLTWRHRGELVCKNERIWMLRIWMRPLDLPMHALPMWQMGVCVCVCVLIRYSIFDLTLLVTLP